MSHNLKEQYFNWMKNKVCDGVISRNNSYRKLLAYLYAVDFNWTLDKDINRAQDGKDLRWTFAYEKGIRSYDELEGPCSVLEMIVALSIRCEEFMDDPEIGDRTSQWFWKMITNLGLGGMTDRRFDEKHVEYVVDRFMNREYEADGRGGLFTVSHPDFDMRDVEIWVQMSWYLDEII